MIRLIFSLVLVFVIVATATTAIARSRHYGALETYRPETNFYNPTNDPDAVFVAGTYAGSDPDPNIRAALRREFGRRGF
jgi:hypothetical protein